jgi:hypothetical protein
VQLLRSFFEAEYMPSMMKPQLRVRSLIRRTETRKAESLATLRPPSTAKYGRLPTEIQRVLDVVLLGRGEAKVALAGLAELCVHKPKTRAVERKEE